MLHGIWHGWLRQTEDCPPAHLLATMDSAASDPPLEKFTTVAAAATEANVDMECVRSLESATRSKSDSAEQIGPSLSLACGLPYVLARAV